jgi:delta14-sterol reductase
MAISTESVTFESFYFAFKWILIYFIYIVALSKLLPGKTCRIKIKSYEKVYKINGLLVFLLTTIFAFIFIRLELITLVPIVEHFWSFFAAANIISILFSIALYTRTKIIETDETDPVRIDYLPDFIADFWFGIERNPEFIGLDLKMFFYQPSLIGLFLLTVGFAEYQFLKYNQISIQMILLLSFWWFYLLLHYIKEEFMLYTWDIIAENFGFMLIWGDTVYLPFLYSICGWTIVDTINIEFSKLRILLLILFNLAASYLFRVSNLQKHQFKLKQANPRNLFYWWNKDLVVLENKLLCSGFWGIGRHLNYTGEILVYLSIATISGMNSLLPYILPFSLLLLLTHRAWRDEQRCKEKYGPLWIKYCRIARFRMIPFVY